MQEISDLVAGTTILGTGGGGDPDEGRRILEADVSSGKLPKICTSNEVDPESYVICVYRCGSILPPGKKPAQEIAKLPVEQMLLRGLKVMRRELGADISAVIPAELGGHNTALAIHTASLVGLPAIDADQVGRAAPELVQSSYQVYGVKATPAVLMDTLGDLLVVHDYADVDQYEKIARAIAMLAGRYSYVMDTPVKAKEIERVALMGTISRSIKLGKKVREANENKQDPVAGIAEILDGYHLFHGKVVSSNLREQGGFLVGTVEISGMGKWRGRKMRVWIKNENLLAWIGRKVIATTPDLIIMVDKQGHGLTNSRMKRGVEIHAIGARAPDVWRTPRGVTLFGPRHFNFKLDYTPIEQLTGS